MSYLVDVAFLTLPLGKVQEIFSMFHRVFFSHTELLMKQGSLAVLFLGYCPFVCVFVCCASVYASVNNRL